MDHNRQERSGGKNVLISNRNHVQCDISSRKDGAGLSYSHEIPQQAQARELPRVVRNDGDLHQKCEHEAGLRDVVHVPQHALCLVRKAHETRKATERASEQESRSPILLTLDRSVDGFEVHEQCEAHHEHHREAERMLQCAPHLARPASSDVFTSVHAGAGSDDLAKLCVHFIASQSEERMSE